MTKRRPTKEQIDQELINEGWTDLSLLYSIAGGHDDPSSLCLSSDVEARDVIEHARKRVVAKIEDDEFEAELARRFS